MCEYVCVGVFVISIPIPLDLMEDSVVPHCLRAVVPSAKRPLHNSITAIFRN